MNMSPRWGLEKSGGRVFFFYKYAAPHGAKNHIISIITEKFTVRKNSCLYPIFVVQYQTSIIGENFARVKNLIRIKGRFNPLHHFDQFRLHHEFHKILPF